MIASGSLTILALSLAAVWGLPPDRAAGAGAALEAGAPRDVELRGELVCLLEEAARLHAVQIPPVHEHLTGVRAEDGALYTLLRTSTSAFLFSDGRFRGRTLVLTGRALPRSSLLEVTRADWLHDGKRYEVYYWCEVCTIKGVDPGACACCQAPVELRERPVGGGPERILPPAAPGNGKEKTP